MSKYVIDDTTIKAVADPLRELNGSTATMTPAEMATAGTDAAAEMQAQAALIAQIKEELQGKATGGGDVPAVVEPLTITENGTYTAPAGVDGYSPIVVNVNASGGDAEEDVAALLGNTMTELNNSIVTTLRTRACQGATNLVTANLPSVTSLGSYAFYQCTGLLTVKLPKLASVSTQTFYGCTKLKHADLGQVGNLSAQTFNACSALTELILSKTGSICTLSNANAISNTPIGRGEGYVYVPSALIAAYESNATWIASGAQFRAKEDYPDICGEV